jgi:eukaryotic-like serine/threonine-protein kinase
MLERAVTERRLGSYELLFELAAGGMATVYVARRIGAAGFERLVVIKRVHRHLLQSGDFRDMLRDEARVASLIRHPNVVPVIDVVELGAPEAAPEKQSELLLVLDYVESVSLSALLKRMGDTDERLAPSVVVRIIADMLAGLHAAHEATDHQGRSMEVVHRDVSPHNVIVGVDGTSRLIDFGIARAASRLTVSSSGSLKGKLGYMSPEQVKQSPLDPRSDVFAAGIVLHEALTGKKLFRGDSEGDILLGILLGEIPPPSSLRPELPPALDRIVMKALERDPEDRYQTAAELQQELESALPPAAARDVARVIAVQAKEPIESQKKRLLAALTIADAMSIAPAAIPEATAVAVSLPPPPRKAPWILAAGALLVGSAGVILGSKLNAPRAEARAIEASPILAASTEAPLVTSKPVESAPPPTPTVSASAAPTAPPRPPPVRQTASELHGNPYMKR